ncbi:MAG: PDZ domain-containing protein [Calditrichaeota bacterium]|nr:MAG: PDZ domain-containing protein [Calditrichota bacterium]
MFNVSALVIILFCSNLFAQNRIAPQKKVFEARDKIMPALVHIEPVKEIYSEGKKRKRTVTGSGVIFSKEGYVVTNNHVAEKAKKVNCILSNKEEVSAEVIGTDPFTDIAVLKLNLDSIKTKIEWAEFGTSSTLEMGQAVFAFGSPLGLSRSMSLGIISSLDRYFEDSGGMLSPYNLWIQTDAAINPGNSGGPLVDINGKVIGINARGIRSGENLGFAIPIDIVKEVVEQLIQNGEVKRSWIGVTIQNLKEFEKILKIKDQNGVLVSSVEEDSPAQIAGILPRDILTEFNGTKISARFEEELPKIRKLFADAPIGSNVEVKGIRNGSPISFELTTALKGKYEEEEFEFSEWGFSAKQLTQRLSRFLKVPKDYGIFVTGTETGSLAQKAKLRTGDLILSIDGQDINSLESFKEFYRKATSSTENRFLLLTENRKSRRFKLIVTKEEG